jgi:hypothetical protein
MSYLFYSPYRALWVQENDVGAITQHSPPWGREGTDLYHPLTSSHIGIPH